ncbi:TPR repeat protein [Bacillus sp. JCM 19046]|nr:TPR repeat protein [Bacillus sp. JCM 19046]
MEQAKHIINQLLELYPDEGSLFILAAEMMIDADEEDEAIEQLLEVREDDDSFLQAQLLLADLYQLQALDEVAEQKLLAAAKKAPEEMIITYALGEFYLDQAHTTKPFLI